MEKKAGTGKKAQMGRGSRTPKAAGSAGALDLSSLFGAATQALTANQASLNQADAQNQNHGDNMVQMFNMITQVMEGQKGAPPAQQLNHASQYLAQHATSGSAKVYSQGLAQAAQQFQGQSAVTPNNAMMLIQSLLGGGQAAAPQGGGADLLGSLLGGGQPAAPQGGGADLLGSLLGGGQASAPQGGGADLLGSLLGGLQQSAPQGNTQQNDGIDLGDVLSAGMAFMNAKNQGQGNMQAAISALVSAGPLGQSSHRQQSGQLVANALLQAVTGMAKRR